MALTRELQEAMDHLGKACALVAQSISADVQIARTSVLVSALDSITNARLNVDALSDEPLGERLVREYMDRHARKPSSAGPT